MNSVQHRPIRYGKVALSLALITLLAPVATDLYLASMPDIAAHLKVSYARVQWTLTVFLLAQGIGQLFFGPLIDRYGRRIPLLLGIVTFILSSMWAGCCDSIGMLVVSRFIQGLSGALLLVIGFCSVRDIAEGAAAARLFAILLTIEGLAPVFAPIAGGYIDANLGWRAVLFTSAGMGLVALVNSWFNLPETLAPAKRIALKPSVIAATYKRIACDPHFLIPTLALSGVFFYLFAYISAGPYLYQTIFGLTPDQFGIVFGVTGGAVIAGAFLSSRLVKTRKVQVVALLGVAIIIAGTVIALVSSLHAGFYGIVAGFMVAMLGLGIAEPALVALSMASQKKALGSTAALMGAMHLMLSSLSTPVSGLLLPMGMTWWFAFLLVSIVATFGLALMLRRKSL